jgi:hypothetical protein
MFAFQELRPQDSIPFLRRVSADFQKNEFARFLSQLELSESPVSDNRLDDLANGSPPRARRVSSSLFPLNLSQDDDAISPREHTFVKTAFGKRTSFLPYMIAFLLVSTHY